MAMPNEFADIPTQVDIHALDRAQAHELEIQRARCASVEARRYLDSWDADHWRDHWRDLTPVAFSDDFSRESEGPTMREGR
jgi:hypothetical protein